jgi:thioredoxin 1
MNKTVLAVLAVVALAGVGFMVFRGASTEPQERETEIQLQEMMQTQNDETAEEPAEFSPTGAQLAKNYYEYNEADYLAARKASKPIFLYFYANWCPTCAAQEPVIVEMMDSADSKYENVVAFRVNFNDNATDADEKKLARDFGVRLQHTMFVLDKQGQTEEKFLGDTSSAKILAAFDQVI